MCSHCQSPRVSPTAQATMPTLQHTRSPPDPTPPRPSILSVCSGRADWQVQGSACTPPACTRGVCDDWALWQSPTMAGVWASANHQASVWCHQLVSRLSKALLAGVATKPFGKHARAVLDGRQLHAALWTPRCVLLVLMCPNVCGGLMAHHHRTRGFNRQHAIPHCTGTMDATCPAASLPAHASDAIWDLLLHSSTPPTPGVHVAPVDLFVADPANVTVLPCPQQPRYVLWSGVQGVLVVDAAALAPCSGFRVLLLDTRSRVASDLTSHAAPLPAAHAQWTHAAEWGRCAH